MPETITRTLPAQFIEDIGQDYAKQLAALTQLPVSTAAFAPTVAAQDPYQAAAYTQAVDPTAGLGAYAPYLAKAGEAATAATALTGPMTTAQTTAYMSPYQQAVIDATLGEFDIQAQKGLTGIGTAAVGAGAFGGGRHGIAEAEYQTQSDRNRAALQANLLQQGYQQATALRQQDLANQLGIGQFQSTLGGGAQNLAQQQIAGLGTLGAGQQAYAQAQADAARQATQTAAYEPYQRLGTYGAGVSSLISGYPAQYGQASTPSASPLQTALGIGTGLAGLYGGLTGKNPFAPIGSVFRGMFG
jgi:hypothetical protein